MSQLYKARITRSGQKSFDCKNEYGQEFKAKALGSLLKGQDSLVVGDYIFYQKSETTDEFIIKELIPRSNEIFRVIVRENKKKVTAANCDHLIILNSVSKPILKTGIIDRFLVRAYQWGIEPIVVFNKMDQYDPSKCDVVFESERLKSLGVSCYDISAKDIEYKNLHLELGIEDLKEKLQDKTTIFLGQSGVGKSKTISRLSAGFVDLKTKKVGKGGKGSHATTWSEIIDCQAFDLIDSPGIRSFSLEDVRASELMGYFPDLEPYSLQCKFKDCAHDFETPGCGFFQHKSICNLLNSRLESYKKLLVEVSETPEWNKKM
ncbi:MAG: ribosome small subunit-dependent GTPase A [Bacteriovoracaceae bacterium]|nr:ribosome small subunit-dependent GTPase A [Bacteriovoracaceae bacterium]